MNQDEVKNNLLAPAQWLRMLIMAGFVLAAWVVWLVVVVLMITQTVTVLITGEPNANLKHFGLVTSAYLQQIISFLVYGTEVRPFPFAPFPECDVSVDGMCHAPDSGPGPRQTEASATAHTAPVDTVVYPATTEPGATTHAAPVDEFEALQQADLAAADSEPFPYDLDPDQDQDKRNKD